MKEYNEHLDELVNAANLKLQAQQKNSESTNENVNVNNDIYSDIRKEIDTNNQPLVKYNSQDSYNEEYNILHTEGQETYEEDYDILHNDEPIFENGPSVSQIEIWKKQFTKEKVFHTQILDKHFVFRTLNRFEYKQIVAINNIDALYREEIICKTCVLFPINYDFKAMAEEDGGYPSTLAQIIMENSGFTKEYGIEIL